MKVLIDISYKMCCVKTVWNLYQSVLMLRTLSPWEQFGFILSSLFICYNFTDTIQYL